MSTLRVSVVGDLKIVFEIRDSDLAGRIGRLKTRHGVLETPFLFPVVDPSLRKQVVPLDKIRDIGFNGIITNAYLLKKHVGLESNIHQYLGFDGVIMTDSGAYQILQYGTIDIENRAIVEYQCRIGSDIGVILDIPTRHDVTYEEALTSVEETLRRAEEVIDIVEECKSTLWVLPIQGGTYLDLLSRAARRACDLGMYSIYAIGSPTTLLERFELDRIVDMIYTVKSIVPSAKPIHLFGAGHPLVIPFVVALGVDLMDSASYILYARDDRYMTWRGTYKLEDLEYFPCNCPVCSRYSPKDLMEMPKHERVAKLAEHNLYVLIKELRSVKQAIREGRLWEYLEERAHSHPSAMRAFQKIKKYVELLYKHSPLSKSNITRAVYILSMDSVYNPKIMLARRRSIDRAVIKNKCIALIPLVPWDEPAYESQLYKRVLTCNRDLENRCDVCFYMPILGVVNVYLSERYPFSQFESVYDFDDRSIEDLCLLIIELVLRYTTLYDTIKLRMFISEGIPWSIKVAKLMLSKIYTLSDLKIDVEIESI